MTLSILDFVTKLAEIEAEIELGQRSVLERAARRVQQEAKREIGHYQQAAGPFPKWPKLADKTVEEKTRLGFAPPDNPLKRTGEMRDSIGYHVNDEGTEAEIGANGVVPVVQELGAPARGIPARDFLGRAVVRKAPEFVADAAEMLKRSLKR